MSCYVGEILLSTSHKKIREILAKNKLDQATLKEFVPWSINPVSILHLAQLQMPLQAHTHAICSCLLYYISPTPEDSHFSLPSKERSMNLLHCCCYAQSVLQQQKQTLKPAVYCTVGTWLCFDTWSLSMVDHNSLGYRWNLLTMIQYFAG